jgi:hypothetical protein
MAILPLTLITLHKFTSQAKREVIMLMVKIIKRKSQEQIQLFRIITNNSPMLLMPLRLLQLRKAFLMIKPVEQSLKACKKCLKAIRQMIRTLRYRWFRQGLVRTMDSNRLWLAKTKNLMVDTRRLTKESAACRSS